MMTVTRRTAIQRKTRSPELERLIRTLEVVANDLPRILREEKAVAFTRLESVEAFEAHMRRISQIPAQLETLSRTIGMSLQVEGATDHLSRIFRAIAAARGVTSPEVEAAPVEVANPSAPVIPVPAAVPEQAQPKAPPQASQPPHVHIDQNPVRVDPATGHVIATVASTRTGFHPIDLNLQKVRDALVPGGEICGRSMYESSRVRLVTARASGEGPWRFQFRRGSLEWAAQGEESGLKAIAALICADRGYIQVPAKLLLEKGQSHLMRSTKGNPILRPGVAVYGSEAILHPGAMAKTRPGDATKHVFVEF